MNPLVAQNLTTVPGVHFEQNKPYLYEGQGLLRLYEYPILYKEFIINPTNILRGAAGPYTKLLSLFFPVSKSS